MPDRGKFLFIFVANKSVRNENCVPMRGRERHYKLLTTTKLRAPKRGDTSTTSAAGGIA